ncbi:hypothetical protein [Solwaraspora sp. WMMA2101]|uniref:hypothetical protein n=1 Tax=Solwaraspora sp. WMMA2101 TaxID=3404124 RepID=UPI003B94F010
MVEHGVSWRWHAQEKRLFTLKSGHEQPPTHHIALHYLRICDIAEDSLVFGDIAEGGVRSLPLAYEPAA